LSDPTNPASTVVLDYYRTYYWYATPTATTKTRTATRQSPYAFSVSGANNLPGALTFVSDQSVYLQGDYNNYVDPTDATKSGKKPASVLADTITTLSVNCVSGRTDVDPSGIRTGQINCGLDDATSGVNKWTPGVSVDGPNKKTIVAATSALIDNGVMYDAADTTFNAAFLSYTDQSSGNLGSGRGYCATACTTRYYSGGLNNYMRMMENWGGKKITYKGSFISLGNPLEFNGALVTAGRRAESYYSAPARDFKYDTSFNDFVNLPPLTPRAVYLKQTSYNRSRN
jgi:hypothetical protein